MYHPTDPYTPEQIREFALKFWLRSRPKTPNYQRCRDAGLNCHRRLFQEVCNLEWRVANGIPTRGMLTHDGKRRDKYYKGPVVCKRSRAQPDKQPKPRPAPGTTAAEKHAYLAAWNDLLKWAARPLALDPGIV